MSCICCATSRSPRIPRSSARRALASAPSAPAWGILALSPTALRFLKQSFNADTEHLAGLSQLAFSGLESFLDSEEAHEGVRAFAEKRAPDFSRFRAAASSS